MKQRLSFTPAQDEDAVEVQMWVEPGGGVPPHVHPSMEERFEVIEGELEFLSGRQWRKAGPGATVVVPAGTRHAYRNSGAQLAHGVCHASPAQSLQEFLEEAAALAREGKLTKQGLPRPGGVLRALRLALRHRKMVVMRPV